MECHYSDVIMGAMAYQITSLIIVYLTVYSGADRRKHQGSLSLAFVRGIYRCPVNSLHIGLVKRKMFPFDDVIMAWVFRVECISLYGILICQIRPRHTHIKSTWNVSWSPLKFEWKTEQKVDIFCKYISCIKHLQRRFENNAIHHDL